MSQKRRNKFDILTSNIRGRLVGGAVATGVGAESVFVLDKNDGKRLARVRDGFRSVSSSSESTSSRRRRRLLFCTSTFGESHLDIDDGSIFDTLHFTFPIKDWKKEAEIGEINEMYEFVESIFSRKLCHDIIFSIWCFQ